MTPSWTIVNIVVFCTSCTIICLYLVEGEQVQDEIDEKDEVAGFLFGTLKQHHPELEEQLGEFKANLKESLKEIVELKAWQLQGQLIRTLLMYACI